MSSTNSRRQFITQSGLVLVALGLRTVSARERRSFVGGESTAILGQLLALANQERTQIGLHALKLDGRACDIAEQHAIEMAQNGFLSHWGMDGRKPYQRYSFSGGTEATAENDSAIDHSAPPTPDEVDADLIRMHRSMHNEVPPDDGHRQTILGPQYTHVGFGVAWRGLHVRLTEIYIARYMAIDPYPAVKPAGSTFIFSGRTLDPAYEVQGIDVFFEEVPRRPPMSFLQVPRPYGLPQDHESLAPKLPNNTFYEDGTAGTIELLERGRFRVPITLAKKQPGIYTIATWIQRGQSDNPFIATHVCVRAE